MRALRTTLAALPLAAALAGCGTAAGGPLSPQVSGTSSGAPGAGSPTARAHPHGTTPHTTTGHPTPTDTGHTSPSHPPSTDDALATVRSYMAREIGMRDPVVGRFRSTGSGTGTVSVRPRLPGQQTLGPVTVVSLRRLTTVWYVTGAQTDSMRVDEDMLSGPVTSPARIHGLRRDGTSWTATVTEDRYGPDRFLGARPVPTSDGNWFDGDLGFRRPTGGTGSVIFAENPGGSVGALRATVVRVRFAPVPAARPAPSCAASTFLHMIKPSVEEDPSSGAVIVRAVVVRCRGGYAEVQAVPRDPQKADGFTAFFEYRNGQWRSLDYGSDVGCGPGQARAALKNACRALGYDR